MWFQQWKILVFNSTFLTALGDKDNEGILYFALRDIFGEAQIKKDKGFRSSIKIHYFQIYNNVIFDLLHEPEVQHKTTRMIKVKKRKKQLY